MISTTYIRNRPSFWTRVMIAFEVSGYARAARDLSRMGYHAEAKNCIEMMRDLQTQ
jgi:hypothetical protein